MTVEGVEDLIAKHFGRRYCVLAGSGSTAIYLLLRAVGTDRRYVLMPSILCPAPLYAILGAGFYPIFCDVEPDSYRLSPPDAAARLTPDTGVLFVPHLFGDLMPRDRLCSLARRHGLFLVEDAAQGAWWTPPVPGSATVVSFGWEKPLSAGWGGAVLTDEGQLAAQVRRLRDAFEPSTPTRLLHCPDGVPPPSAWLRPLVPSQLHRIVEALASWPRQSVRRRLLSRMYAHALRHLDLRLPPEAHAPLWRFTVLLPNAAARSKVLVDLWRQGLSAWRMYPPLHVRWPGLCPRAYSSPLPAAEDVGRRILNLVIDPEMTDEDVLRHALALEASLKELTAT